MYIDVLCAGTCASMYTNERERVYAMCIGVHSMLYADVCGDTKTQREHLHTACAFVGISNLYADIVESMYEEAISLYA